MKKTLIALLALASVAAAHNRNDDGYIYNAEDADICYTLYSANGDISLSTYSTILSSDLDDRYVHAQDFVAKFYKGDTSPGVFSASFTLSLNSLNTGNIFTITTDAPWDSRAGGNRTSSLVGFGLFLDTNGELKFNRSNVTSSYGVSMNDNKSSIATLVANKTYSITLTSYASTKGNASPGRGTDNFYISVSADGQDTITKTLAGFGLNAETGYRAVVLGGGGTNGTIRDLVIKTVPEPTTATLSLLALAGLAARRRRK